MRVIAYAIALALAHLHPSDAITHAAEIECDSYYSEYWDRAPAEQIGSVWPSGVGPTQRSCLVGYLHGSITMGDYAKVAAFYRKHHPFLNTVRLHSPGGDVDEAMKIGSLLRKYLISADAPSTINGFTFLAGHDATGKTTFACEGDGCICASACALVWFGAPERSGTVGLHRPRSADSAGFSELTAREAANTYREILVRVRSYLAEMEAPPSVIESMISTGSAEIVWVEDGALEGQDLSRAPSFAEWADAACGPLSVGEYRAMLELQIGKRERNLEHEEQLLLTLLSEKYDAKTSCENRLKSANRDSLPPP